MCHPGRFPGVLVLEARGDPGSGINPRRGLFGSPPPLPHVIPERHPGLWRFPEVLVLERFLEGSSSITLEGGVPVKATDYFAYLSHHVIPGRRPRAVPRGSCPRGSGSARESRITHSVDCHIPDTCAVHYCHSRFRRNPE